MADAIQRVRPVLGGRADVAGEPRSIQLFGQCVSIGVPFAGWPINPSVFIQVPGWSTEDALSGCGEERLWLVTSYAFQVIRQQVNGLLTNLSSTQIKAQQPSAGVSIAAHCVAKLAIRVGGAGGERGYVVDANQSLPVMGSWVDVQAFVPAGMVEVPPGMAVAPQGNTVADIVLMVSIRAIEDYPSRWENKVTWYLNQAAGDGVAGIRIAPGAVSYEIAQGPEGIASVEWHYRTGGQGLVGFNTQVIPWIPGARKTELIERVPEATNLMPDIDLVNARRFAATFMVRP